MLADNKPLDLDTIRYPVIVSPKLDGIRAVIKDGVVLSRTLKPIPNKYIQEILGRFDFNGLDGELIVGPPTSKTVYRDTNSFVMSQDKVGIFHYYIFDKWDSNEIYSSRLYELDRYDSGILISVLDARMIVDKFSLLREEEFWLDQGYEGLILRDPNSPYKFGRSTSKEGYLLKLKRFVDSEALIIGFEEELHNSNEAEVNELGRTKRSTHKAGMVGKGTLGAFLCRDLYSGIEFNVGSGFTADDRIQFWNDQNRILNTIIKYKYFPIGNKDKPRHPIFLGFRNKIDI
jgi:DNA ligase-1